MAFQGEGSISSPEQLARDLYDAVDNNDLQKVTQLLGQGADPNHALYWSEEWRDDPPLHWACLKGYLPIVKTLIEHGADVNKGRRLFDWTPLHRACWGGHKDVVVYLISETNCDVDLRDYACWTPLHHACRWGHKDIFQYLVEDLKCDVDVKDSRKRSPLDSAMEGMYDNVGGVDIALYLIRRGYGDDWQRVNALGAPCYHGNLDVVKELVEEHHANPNCERVYKKWSPLARALQGIRNNTGCVDLALYLVNRGCGDDQQKLMLLWKACQYGKLDVVKELVEQHHVNPNESVQLDLSYEQQFPLDSAIENVRGLRGCIDVALYLINRDCPCDDRQKAKLLCKACRMGKLDVVKELVEQHHVNPNDVTDDKGRTPLDWARRKRLPKIIEYLESQPQSSQQEGAVPKGASKSSDVVKPASKKQKQDQEIVPGRKRTSKSSDVVKPASKKQDQGSQRTPQRECPNCGDSCHIRCKSCPHCEHQFQSSAKKQAKPNDEPKTKRARKK